MTSADHSPEPPQPLPERYEPAALEPRWQQYWAARRLFEADESDPRPKHYILEMFPYPSGRLHMGHVRNYCIGDVMARYKRMRGYNVLHPMGWDAFGLPAENAARKHATHPARWTRENIEHMRGQLAQLGYSFDWRRELATCDPAYYRWEQLFFLWMLEDGLAYRKRATLNWCDECQTVLANEQVNPDGTCYIHDHTKVGQRELEQWFVRITKYADELLTGHAQLAGGWPEKVLEMQRNWIGRSEGALVRFALEGRDEAVEVFTTRPDTLAGATFVSLAAEHPLVTALPAGRAEEAAVRAFVQKVRAEPRDRRAAEDYEKEGVFTGAYALNPLTGARVPVWVANFVLMEYGTGAVMAVPAHDERDFAFARKYGLPVQVVIQPVPPASDPQAEIVALDGATMDAAYVGPGVMVASGELDGTLSEEGKKKVVARLTRDGRGEGKVTYKLRDWGVSRQRYWGCPIPVLHCPKCGIVPVPEKDLPVVLPEDLPYSKDVANPLAHAEAWLRVDCPRCGGAARRETDTFDTFVESSWYFLRYCDAGNQTEPWARARLDHWMPCDQYVGGVEHAVLHLIYARFFHKFLRDRGLVKGDEPFLRLFSQGMVCMTTLECPKHGWRYREEVRDDGTCVECGSKVEAGRSVKMSKSKRNVVEPSEMIAKYGVDTVRVYSVFGGPPEKNLDWSEADIQGVSRFLVRAWRVLREGAAAAVRGRAGAEAAAGAAGAAWAGLTAAEQALRHKIHDTIDRVTRDVEERWHFNTGIARLMELVSALGEALAAKPAPRDAVVAEAADAFVRLVAPFAPHLAEELWAAIGATGSVFEARWPAADAALLVKAEVELVLQVNGKTRGKVTVAADLAGPALEAAVMAQEGVRRHIDGKTVVKTIVVPGRLVNVVVK
jgi:leucyl-tRNA synthetase